MNHQLKIIGILICLLALSVSSVKANVINADSYAHGLETSKKQDAPLVVLVHGSDWNPWSQRVHESIFKSTAFRQSLSKGTVIFADVDVLQSPDEVQKKENDERNKGWKGTGVHTYPAVCVYAPDGVLLGTRQGKALPKSIDSASKAIHDLISLCQRHLKLREQAEKARADKNTKAELKLLAELGKMPLTRPKGLLERVKELDPDDQSGHYAQLSFPHWNKLLADTTQRTKNGQAAEVQAELNKMLESKVYSVDQLALVYVALGTCHRLQEDHAEQAAASFKKAQKLAPDSFAGQMAKRILDAWYTEKKPTG